MLEEGQKLTEQQFKTVNSNKKLQAKVKEADATNTSLNKTIAEQAADIKRCAPRDHRLGARYLMVIVWKRKSELSKRMKKDISKARAKCRQSLTPNQKNSRI